MPVTLLKDELLYSAIVRQYHLSSELSWRCFLSTLFGNSCNRVSLLLPQNINNASESFNITSHELITNHSILPYFKTFSYTEKYLNNKAKLLNEDQINLFHVFGINNGILFNKKYCTMCIESDIKMHGVAYWHRSHHLPFVTCCAEHNLCLIASKHPPKNCKTTQAWLPFTEKTVTTHSGKFELSFSKLSRDILNSNFIFDPVKTKKLLFSEMQNLKLTRGFFLDRDKVRIYIESTINDCSPTFFKWVLSITQKAINSVAGKKEIKNYAFFLFWISVLYSDIHTFKKEYDMFNSKKNNSPTSTPICKSTIISSFISNTHSARKTAEELGVSPNYILNTVKAAGLAVSLRPKKITLSMKQQIQSELRAGKKTQEIAKKFNLSTGSIEQILTQNPSIKKHRLEIRQKEKLKRRQSERLKITRYLNKYKNSSRSDVKRVCRISYYWLYKHDREWLSSTLPDKLKRYPRKDQVNWKKRDTEYKKKLLAIVKNCMAIEPPRRITIEWLAKELGTGSALKNQLHNLPLTESYINNVRETVDIFQVRRIAWAIEKIKENNSTVNRHQVSKLTTISNLRALAEEYLNSQVN
ncbi:TnsD family Tn7-like transposition protein [Endozoicomonas euniceicola]|uniref:TnsD family transposase n=1 Tax=Endozoicomonas euniceicola TaxID=1234143 RepID=A0ABY6GRT6_9GAMM|nr:TnsD family Tn7-like transposition protein [Endozoicomonas euniceicola]UYM15456.1 TnsD family transposase [Endozoicomonas euniceicola]